MSNTSKILTLVAASVLLISCKGMYGNGYKANPSDADQHTAKTATDHVSNVTNTAASRANQTSHKP